MLIFLDTEFTSFHDPELISIGLVSACGQYTFYAERNDFDLARCSDFVRSAVLPKLGQSKYESLSRESLGMALQAWLDRLHALDGDKAVHVLYDSQTDFDLFRLSLPEPPPTWLVGCNVANELNSLTWANFQQEDPPNAHHALEDARQLRSDWLSLQTNR